MSASGHRSLNIHNLCYVPDPYRLVVVSDENEVRAMSCDANTVVWICELKLGCLFYAPSHGVILVNDMSENKVVCLYRGNGSQMQDISLPEEVPKIRAMCLVNGQIIVASEDHISYHSLS